jgi:hypothetical protein
MTGFLPQTTPYLTYLFVAALVAITAYFLFRAQRQLQPARRDEEPELEPESDAELESRLPASLDAMTARLERLVREANRAAERLEAALAVVRGHAVAAHPRPVAEVEWEEFQVEGPADERQADEHAADEDQPANQAAGLRVAAPSGPPRPRPYGEIYALADAGNDPEEIARRLGIPAGEVHLILGLRAAR